MSATAADYKRVMDKAWDGVGAVEMANVWDNHAKSYVRAFWKQETGRKFPWPIRIGSGSRRTWLHRGIFTVNPAQGWYKINHDMSHFIHWHLTGLTHKGGHLSRERDGATLIKRRFLETERALKKPKVDLVAKRAASVEKRLKAWETKRKRAENALKTLRQKKRYYDRVLGAR